MVEVMQEPVAFVPLDDTPRFRLDDTRQACPSACAALCEQLDDGVRHGYRVHQHMKMAGLDGAAYPASVPRVRGGPCVRGTQLQVVTRRIRPRRKHRNGRGKKGERLGMDFGQQAPPAFRVGDKGRSIASFQLGKRSPACNICRNASTWSGSSVVSRSR
jgi:hypothetical protein